MGEVNPNKCFAIAKTCRLHRLYRNNISVRLSQIHVNALRLLVPLAITMAASSLSALANEVRVRSAAVVNTQEARFVVLPASYAATVQATHEQPKALVAKLPKACLAQAPRAQVASLPRAQVVR